jgi:small subunit ribosomal protein S1
MINEANQDAEESQAIEKTATEQPESTTPTADAISAVNAEAAGQATAQEPAKESAEEPAQGPQPPPAAEAAVPAEAESASHATETTEHVPAESDAAGAKTEPAAAPSPVPASPPERKPNRVVMAPKVPFAPAPPPPAAPPPTAPTSTASTTPASSARPSAPVEETATGDIDFGAILEQFEQEQAVFHQGDLVEGKVVGITDRGVLVDFGYKSEGFVPVEEFTGPGGEMTAVVGDPVEVIIRTMSGDSAPQLSRIDALGRKVWDDIEAAFNSETPVIGRVVDKTKGGLRIDLNGVEAFLPGSQIDSRPIRGLDSYIGQDIEAQVIKFSRRRNNIVLSRKIITDKVVNEQKAETLGKIDVGYIVDGVIKNLTEYGAFVDIGGIDGLLHVTDMSWGRIHHPGDVLKVGEHIQVKVLKLDREREKVSLGYKQLLPDPWSTVVEVYPVNTKLKGTVSSVTEYGVFVELEPGVEGLVHVSEISWSRKRLFHKGQEVEVQVLGVDTVEKRISLGMKQFAENPWDTVDLRYPVGSKVRGKVRNLTDFGAFIELEEGIDGLVHVSDISWAKKIKHPKDVLKKDQEVEAIVTSIDKRGQRLSLSMKDLTPSAWEGFVATHRPGDVVRGKVSRFTNFGVFVELGEGLEGLCHISELSDERVDRPESVAELGQEMDFKILRIEPADQKIGLSHRAVGKESEPVVDTKIYSTEAKGGMASLGELAKLRLGETDAAPSEEEDPEEKKRAKQAAKKMKAEEFAAKEAQAALGTESAIDETSTRGSGTEDSPVAEIEKAEIAAASSEDNASLETPTEQISAGDGGSADSDSSLEKAVAAEGEIVAEGTLSTNRPEPGPAAEVAPEAEVTNEAQTAAEAEPAAETASTTDIEATTEAQATAEPGLGSTAEESPAAAVEETGGGQRLAEDAQIEAEAASSDSTAETAQEPESSAETPTAEVTKGKPASEEPEKQSA